MIAAFVLAAPTLRRPRRAAPPHVPQRRTPPPPTMLAKRARRRSKGGGSAGRASPQGSDGSGSGSGSSATPGARDDEEAYLASKFSEDVTEPLVTRGQRAGGDKRTRKRGNANANANAGAKVPSGAEVLAALRAQVPRDRTAWLNLFVRGAWYGIGGLVALFFVTHLVLVRDWIPSGAPPAPPPAPPG